MANVNAENSCDVVQQLANDMQKEFEPKNSKMCGCNKIVQHLILPRKQYLYELFHDAFEPRLTDTPNLCVFLVGCRQRYCLFTSTFCQSGSFATMYSMNYTRDTTLFALCTQLIAVSSTFWRCV